jgi:hypothetical protein
MNYNNKDNKTSGDSFALNPHMELNKGMKNTFGSFFNAVKLSNKNSFISNIKSPNQIYSEIDYFGVKKINSFKTPREINPLIHNTMDNNGFKRNNNDIVNANNDITNVIGYDNVLYVGSKRDRYADENVIEQLNNEIIIRDDVDDLLIDNLDKLQLDFENEIPQFRFLED